jgi:hypothetical protein
VCVFAVLAVTVQRSAKRPVFAVIAVLRRICAIRKTVV